MLFEKRFFRIAAWLLIALSQIPVIMAPVNRVFTDGRYLNVNASIVLSWIGRLAVPLLLIADFSIILSSKENYKKLIIRFGALSAAVVLLMIPAYERYILAILSIGSTREAAKAAAAELFRNEGYISVHLFVDLFLSTLVM